MLRTAFTSALVMCVTHQTPSSRHQERELRGTWGVPSHLKQSSVLQGETGHSANFPFNQAKPATSLLIADLASFCHPMID